MSATSQQPQVQASNQNRGETQDKNGQADNIRSTNIAAAKGLADVLKSSLGPKGMDKMIMTSKGETLITNDGATILKNLSVLHPCAKILVEASKAQDIEAGDGTTSVVIFAGALLSQTEILLKRGIHPSIISEGYALAMKKCIEVLNDLATPIKLEDKDHLIQCVKTSLASKILATSCENIAPIAVDAVLQIMENSNSTNVDLNDIKIVKKVGGVIDDIECLNGLVFPNNRPSHSAGGPTKIEKPKIALIQFCLSSPKTDMENNIVVGDYSQIDKVLKDERKYIINLVKKIADSGCNVVLIQKSVLRDAVNELSLHFLAKKRIMVVKDIERQDVEFICKTIGCTPVAHIDQLTPEKLGTADLIHEETLQDGGRILKVTGVPESKTLTLFLRGSNFLIIDETDRSLHDALCVVRCLVKNKSIVPGGGAPEIEMAQKLEEYANTLPGISSTVVQYFSNALETIPYTLAENFGLPPVTLVTELRNKHKKGAKNCGLNAKIGCIVDNAITQKIMQPTLVTESALTLATEVVRMILKIDDLVITR